ncbi:MAG TPA: TonB-dependent receptor [Pirellulaceae bacterium]|jgi:hypothetical protein|nr:TonB-dependent receptor [Pirellulaceae bacterium]
MSSNPEPSSTSADIHAKALAINLDGSVYGSVAEIGAGQEVARRFFSVGAASGTVAKTISAYDKTVSDAIYGHGTRYVSKERLEAMLDHEYPQLLERLAPVRGATTKFFAFAETAAARNYAGDNEQHAWLGLRFQTEPQGEPNQVILHVNLMDPTNARQQEALGILGINLLHAVHYRRGSIDDFLGGLWDELSLDRLEIDVLEISGPAMACLDARLCAVAALRRGMGRALVFDSAGRIVEPSSVLRKRPLIINRGRFSPYEPVYAEMLRAGERHFRQEGAPVRREPLQALELSLFPVGGEGPTDEEALERIAPLFSVGTAIVSTFGEGYCLAEYLRRYTAEPVRFVMGASLLAKMLERQFYGELPGGLLESLGRFLSINAKLYVYPMPREAVLAALGPAAADRFQIEATASGDVTAESIRPQPPIDHLYRYLRECGWVESIRAEP